jgi:hypothetical protein
MIVSAIVGASALSATPSPRPIMASDCVICMMSMCGGNSHVASTAYEFDMNGHGPHGMCLAGGCCVYGYDPCHHPSQCVDQFVDARRDYRSLRKAIDRNDVDAVARFVKRYPDAVVVNESRAALQMLGCDSSSVLAHFPLSGARFEQVQRALATEERDVTVSLKPD